MKNLKFFSLLVGLAIIVAACCKSDPDPAPCGSCPLPDGSTCPSGMYNVGGTCACPEGKVKFNNSCVSINDIPNTSLYLGDINCFCLDRFFIRFYDDDNSLWSASVQRGNYNRPMGVAQGGATFEGDPSGFNLWLYPLQTPDPYDCFPGVITVPRFSGYVQNDSLYFNIYIHQQGPDFDTPVDSCVGYVFPKL